MFHIKQERRLDFLDRTPESPQENLHKSRGNPQSLSQPERALCTPNLLEMKADSHSLIGQESRSSTDTRSAALSHQLKLEKNPEVPAVSGKDIVFPLSST